MIKTTTKERTMSQLETLKLVKKMKKKVPDSCLQTVWLLWRPSGSCSRGGLEGLLPTVWQLLGKLLLLEKRLLQLLRKTVLKLLLMQGWVMGRLEEREEGSISLGLEMSLLELKKDSGVTGEGS